MIYVWFQYLILVLELGMCIFLLKSVVLECVVEECADIFLLKSVVLFLPCRVVSVHQLIGFWKGKKFGLWHFDTVLQSFQGREGSLIRWSTCPSLMAFLDFSATLSMLFQSLHLVGWRTYSGKVKFASLKRAVGFYVKRSWQLQSISP